MTNEMLEAPKWSPANATLVPQRGVWVLGVLGGLGRHQSGLLVDFCGVVI